MIRRLASVGLGALVLLSPAPAVAADGRSGTYTSRGLTRDLDLVNDGTTTWQFFELAGGPGTTFVGAATSAENTAHCGAGSPDGTPNVILCGPLALRPATHLGSWPR